MKKNIKKTLVLLLSIMLTSMPLVAYSYSFTINNLSKNEITIKVNGQCSGFYSWIVPAYHSLSFSSEQVDKICMKHFPCVGEVYLNNNCLNQPAVRISYNTLKDNSSIVKLEQIYNNDLRYVAKQINNQAYLEINASS